MKKTNLVLGLMLVMVLVICTAMMAQTTIYVNYSTGNDGTGDGSSGSPYKTFHKGYTEAASSGDTIDLTGTFDWTNADETGDTNTSKAGYVINKDLTIQGQSADQTIVQAHANANIADRGVFKIESGKTVVITDLTIQHGYKGQSYGYNEGGGVYNSGTLTINRCTICYNNVSYNNDYGDGGGIENRGYLLLQNSTLHNNTAACQGGAIHDGYYGTCEGLDVINCTIVNNTITDGTGWYGGAGIYFRGGSGSITNSTIAHNNLAQSGPDSPGVVYYPRYSDRVLNIKNSIVAENYKQGGLLPNYEYDIMEASSGWGSIIDNGYNIFGKYYTAHFTVLTTTWVDEIQGAQTDGTFELQDAGSTSGSLNISSTLADNNTVLGTQTLALSSGSVAINTGSNIANGSISIPTTDQCGCNRIDAVDIGAFEFDGESPVPVNLSSFYALFIEGTPTLYWTTQTEENNSYWNVYRGLSENFETAILLNANNPVSGNGTTNYPSEYEYEDVQPVIQNTPYWYWIEDVSTDGESEVHTPIILTIPLEDSPIIPVSYGLYQNYPNPFNPSTSISFNLQEDSDVELIIYNVKGEKIKTIMNEHVYADQNIRRVWDGTDRTGKQVSSGVYFYKLITRTIAYQRKMVLVQ